MLTIKKELKINGSYIVSQALERISRNSFFFPLISTYRNCFLWVPFKITREIYNACSNQLLGPSNLYMLDPALNISIINMMDPSSYYG